MKESYPVQLAEYAVANKIAKELAFAWWIQKVLCKHDQIIAKVKSQYWRRMHKYGICLPHMIEEVYKIDEDTGTDFWHKALEKEMKNVMPAFEFIDGDKVPIGYTPFDCHLVFDIKMSLQRKVRLVAGGHQTDPPKELVYSSMVSRDSVCIMFMVAALNDLEILSVDVQNAYLNAPMKEKVYMIAGKEFGENFNCPALIV